jgi:hypothetical protein
LHGIFRSKFGKVTAFYVTATELTPKLNNHLPGGSTQFVRELVATNQTRAATITTNTTTNLPSTTVSAPLPPPVEADNAEQQETRMPSAKESATVDEYSIRTRAPTTSKEQQANMVINNNNNRVNNGEAAAGQQAAQQQHFCLCDMSYTFFFCLDY